MKNQVLELFFASVVCYMTVFGYRWSSKFLFWSGMGLMALGIIGIQFKDNRKGESIQVPSIDHLKSLDL